MSGGRQAWLCARKLLVLEQREIEEEDEVFL